MLLPVPELLAAFPYSDLPRHTCTFLPYSLLGYSHLILSIFMVTLLPWTFPCLTGLLGMTRALILSILRQAWQAYLPVLFCVAAHP